MVSLLLCLFFDQVFFADFVWIEGLSLRSEGRVAIFPHSESVGSLRRRQTPQWTDAMCPVNGIVSYRRQRSKLRRFPSRLPSFTDTTRALLAPNGFEQFFPLAIGQSHSCEFNALQTCKMNAFTGTNALNIVNHLEPRNVFKTAHVIAVSLGCGHAKTLFSNRTTTVFAKESSGRTFELASRRHPTLSTKTTTPPNRQNGRTCGAW